MDGMISLGAGNRAAQRATEVRGMVLVGLSALVWSFGGAIARSISIDDTWTVVFWRSVFASLFLLAFMLWRDGPAGTRDLFRRMGWPGVTVGLCFMAASISFVVAISYTTVANVVLIGAGTPLIAALIGRVVFGMPVSAGTWAAIAAVIAGVAIMVSGSAGTGGSLIGIALALLMASAFATATVTTRQYHGVRMSPAVCFGTAAAAVVASLMAGGFAAGPSDMALLFAFGALNLGMGMAFFVTGARLAPATMTALIGTGETVFSPVWVWLLHGETPGGRSLLGGGVVLAALLVHIMLEASRSRAR
jgi:drug/metabolite transporter (DMT)-like permease